MSKKRNKKRSRVPPISEATLEAAAKISKDWQIGSGNYSVANSQIVFPGLSGVMSSGTSTSNSVYVTSAGTCTSAGRTTAEEAEYQTLRKAHDLEVKEARKQAFAKLPRVTREAIIANLELPQIASEVKAATCPQSARLQELENKSNLYTTLSYSGWNGESWTNRGVDVGLPLEDLRRINVDVTFEEEVLSEKSTFPSAAS